MRRRACLHPDQAGRQFAEEIDHLRAAELPFDDNLALGIDAVHLEYGLGEIQTNRGNPHVDDPLM